MQTAVMQEVMTKLFPLCFFAAVVALMTGFVQFR